MDNGLTPSGVCSVELLTLLEKTALNTLVKRYRRGLFEQLDLIFIAKPEVM